MSYIDIIIAIPLVISFYLGYREGMISKLLGFIGFIASIFLSIIFAKVVGGFLVKYLSFGKDTAPLIGGVLLFILLLVGVSFLKKIFSPKDKVNKMFNMLVGGAFGLIQAIVIVSAFLYIAALIKYPPQNDRNKSILCSKISPVLPTVVDYFITYAPDAKSKIEKILPSTDSTKTQKKK